jgi:hypothetical protein
MAWNPIPLNQNKPWNLVRQIVECDILMAKMFRWLAILRSFCHKKVTRNHLKKKGS